DSRPAWRFISSLHEGQVVGFLLRAKKNLQKEVLFAGGRTRTSTLLLEVDFESTASTISPHRQNKKVSDYIEIILFLKARSLAPVIGSIRQNTTDQCFHLIGYVPPSLLGGFFFSNFSRRICIA